MEVQLNGRRYVFQWEYVNSEERTLLFLHNNTSPDSHIPKKLHTLAVVKDNNTGLEVRCQVPRYTGMAICRVKTPGDDGKLQLLHEGYSFRRNTEKIFDKLAARKYSLQHALRVTGFAPPEREIVWAVFLAIHPPATGNITKLELRNRKLQQQYDTLRDWAEKNGWLDKALREV